MFNVIHIGIEPDKAQKKWGKYEYEIKEVSEKGIGFVIGRLFIGFGKMEAREKK